MSDESTNPLPETTQELQETATDVTDAMERMAAAFESLGPHLEHFVTALGKLQPVEAVKQIPEAASEAASGAGDAVGDVVSGAGHAAGAAPAVVTDTLDTAGDAGSAVVRKAKRYSLRKGRR